MALLFCDGFEDGTTYWALTSTATGTGRSGTGLVGSGNAQYTLVATTAGPLIVGCAYKPPSGAAGATTSVMTFQNNSGGSIHVVIGRGGNGEVVVQRFSTVLATSAAGILPLNTWCYVEVKVVIHDTTGSVVVKVNGATIHSLTGIDTRDSPSTDVAQVLLGGQWAGIPASGTAWDDVYIADSTGSFNNDFIGDVIVEHLRPAADDTAQWLGSDGNSTNNYDLVDEAGTYSSTDYVTSSTVGQRDLYTVTSSAKSATTAVAAVMVVAVAVKTDTGSRGVKLDIKEGSGGTVRQSAELLLPTSYGELRATFDRKGDGTGWTVADVNALRIGYEVSS